MRGGRFQVRAPDQCNEENGVVGKIGKVPVVFPLFALYSQYAIVRLKPEERKRFFEVYGPWAMANGLKAEEMLNVYWEEELETDADELRARLGIEMPPNLREIRKKLRDQKKAEKAAQEAKA